MLNTKQITKEYNCFVLTGKRQRVAINHPHVSPVLLSPLILRPRRDAQGPGAVVLPSFRTQKGLSPPNWRENKQQVAHPWV